MFDLSDKGPLIVSYGAGVDSTAVLVGLADRGIQPDLIMFADVGAEKPETYAYLAIMDRWLESVGFPPITIVRRSEQVAQRVPDRKITDEHFRLGNLPALAFGGHTCSEKWKIVPQQKFVAKWQPAQDAWPAGKPCVRVIGFDGGEGQRTCRMEKYDDEKYVSWMPLQEWHWDRAECVRQIAAVGLPVPIKSACYFCPASKAWELLWLAAEHPELFLEAIALEDQALASGKLKGCEGLWRSKSWRGWAESIGLLEGLQIMMERNELLALMAETMPATAGTVQLTIGAKPAQAA